MTDRVIVMPQRYVMTPQIADWLVESGNDCESITVAPAQEIAAALVSAHMVAK